MDSGVYIVAHELKSPWATMRQLALNLDNDNLDTTKRKMVSLSNRAMKQVEDLTRVARLEDGLFKLEPVAIRAICDDIARELQYLYRHNHRTLSTSYRNKSRLVVANRDLLRSILYNFCTNALHYSDNETCSSLIVSDHEDYVRVRIRDYGPALPSSLWRELKSGSMIQPTSVSMRPGSSGLGLFIATKFSRYMNASVSAIRHRDGTSFIIDLPTSRQLTFSWS